MKYSKQDQQEIAKHYRSEVERIEGLRMDGEQGFIRCVSFD